MPEQADEVLDVLRWADDGGPADQAERERCAICERESGSTKPGLTLTEGVAALGELVTCSACGLRVCPECLSQADCCFRDADAHLDDPNWSPPGWTRCVLDNLTFKRAENRAYVPKGEQ